MSEENKSKPEWVKLSSKEIEDLIIELAKKGYTPAKIGLILRDQHGIPSAKAILNKKILKVIKEKGIVFTKEKDLMEKRIEKLKEHSKRNKHDYSASQSLTKKLWAVKKLTN